MRGDSDVGACAESHVVLRVLPMRLPWTEMLLGSVPACREASPRRRRMTRSGTADNSERSHECDARRVTSFVGDELLPHASLVIDHERQLPAPPPVVWPWIVQLGKDRAGWYLPLAVERILPAHFRAARHVDSQWQHLAVGDCVPDCGGRDGWLEAAMIDAPSALVYRSERRGTAFTWALLLSTTSGGSAIHLRFRGALRSRGWKQRCVVAIADVADWSTAAPMLRGLEERIDRQPPLD